ncbi:MAG TPA: hypothetical protein VLH39_06070 [Magnetospirillaceae bacterium]|nr:hypothetical protein [Magnetospirillaceae bacterium]
MNRNKIRTAALVIPAALALASCQDFFSTSWAAWAAGTPSVPSGLTGSEAMEISNLAISNRDTSLARALLPQMAGFMAGTPSAALTAAAVDTAVLATGIDEAFGKALESIGTDIIETGTIDPADYDAVAGFLASVTVSPHGFAVFEYIRDNFDPSVPADLAAVKAMGLTAVDFAMAAAALLVEQANQDAVTLATLIDGTATLTITEPNYLLAQGMLDLAIALDPTNEIVTLVDGW